MHEKTFCIVITFPPLLHRYHFWLPKRSYCFFFRILIFECYLQLSIFYWYFISNTYCLQIHYIYYILLHLTYYYCFSTIDGFVVFHYVGDSLFFPDFLFFWFAVFTFINQLMQLLSSRGVLPNKCFPMSKKLSKKYIFERTHFCEFWVDSRKFMKVKILSWLVRESSSSRIFTWSRKFSQWGQKVLNCETQKNI